MYIGIFVIVMLFILYNIFNVLKYGISKTIEQKEKRLKDKQVKEVKLNLSEMSYINTKILKLQDILIDKIDSKLLNQINDSKNVLNVKNDVDSQVEIKMIKLEIESFYKKLLSNIIIYYSELYDINLIVKNGIISLDIKKFSKQNLDKEVLDFYNTYIGNLNNIINNNELLSNDNKGILTLEMEDILKGNFKNSALDLILSYNASKISMDKYLHNYDTLYNNI